MSKGPREPRVAGNFSSLPEVVELQRLLSAGAFDDMPGDKKTFAADLVRKAASVRPTASQFHWIKRLAVIASGAEPSTKKDDAQAKLAEMSIKRRDGSKATDDVAPASGA